MHIVCTYPGPQFVMGTGTGYINWELGCKGGGRGECIPNPGETEALAPIYTEAG